MRTIPPALQSQFIAHLKHKAVPDNALSFYAKWLRFYLDYCEKYHFPHTQTSSLGHFLNKLQEKKQTPAQQQQARHAISLYYELLRPRMHVDLVCSSQGTLTSGNPSAGSVHPGASSFERDSESIEESSPTHAFTEPPRSPVSPPRRVSLPQGISWKAEYARLADEIKLRHYSPKTLRTYTQWVRHYQTFTRSRDPGVLSTQDVKEFLTSLAVDQKVSASTQNQAFNALLFFHRHVLNMEFGKVEGVVRAKRKPYIPVVLSRPSVPAQGAISTVHYLPADRKSGRGPDA